MVSVTEVQSDNETYNNVSDATSVEIVKDMEPLSSDTETPVKKGQSLNKKRLLLLAELL